jgi:N-methylhydantoinase A/oxoprolinase/acetone carboxylase beta subunit
VPVAQAADAVLRMANGNIAAAVGWSHRAGIDPRAYVLVAYGGARTRPRRAGGRRARGASRADPWSPGLVSAFGLWSRIRRWTWSTPRSTSSGTTAWAPPPSRAWARRRAAAAAHGLDVARSTTSFAVDARYARQAFELTVPVERLSAGAAELREAFGRPPATVRLHLADRPVDIVNYRVRVTETSPADIAPPRPGTRGRPASSRGRSRWTAGRSARCSPSGARCRPATA